jgi:hypothetical protein
VKLTLRKPLVVADLHHRRDAVLLADLLFETVEQRIQELLSLKGLRGGSQDQCSERGREKRHDVSSDSDGEHRYPKLPEKRYPSYFHPGSADFRLAGPIRNRNRQKAGLWSEAPDQRIW